VLEQQTSFDGAQRTGVARRFDAGGHLVRATVPSYDVTKAPYTWWTDFDPLGRPASKSMVLDDPNIVRSESYLYSGLTTTTSLTGTYTGPTRTRTEDLAGRVLQTTDGAAGRVRFRYEPLGLLALTEDPKGNVSTSTYDARGRLIGIQDPDKGPHVYEYDGFDQPITRTDARNAVIRTVYDTLGRPTQRTIDGAPTPLATWTYDVKRKGALDGERSGNGFVRAPSYDLAGRVTQRTTEIDGRSFVTDYGYNCRGHLVSVRYPSGKELGFDRNERGYLAHEDDWGFSAGPRVTLRTIDAVSARGAAEQATLANGAQDKLAYLAATGQLASHQVVTGSTKLLDASYRYDDAAANLTAQTNNVLGVTEAYRYDGVNRLDRTTRTFASGPATVVTYAYDAVGNFTSKSDRATGFVYGNAAKSAPTLAGPNGLRSYTRAGGGTVSDFRYDANGNLIAGDGRTLVYDWVFEVPTSIARGGATTTFAYDPEGARFKKVENGRTTYYVDGKLYEHTEDAAGNQTLLHFVGGSVLQTLARPAGSPTANQTTSFLHGDRLGSTELITPGTAAELATAIAANMLERHAFDPYGAPRNPDWTDGSGVWASPTTSRGFTAHDHLGDHQLVHMNGRVYDPLLGRFVSVDPIVSEPLNTQAFNRYGYLSSNPTSGTDPSGFAGVVYESGKDIDEELIVTAKCPDATCRRNRDALRQLNLRRARPGRFEGRGVDFDRGGQTYIKNDSGDGVGRRIVENRLDPGGFSRPTDTRGWLEQNGLDTWEKWNPFRGFVRHWQKATFESTLEELNEASAAVPLGTPVVKAVTGSLLAGKGIIAARFAAGNARHAAAVEVMAKWLEEGGYATRIRPRNWLDIPGRFRYPDIEVWEPLAGNARVLVGFVEVKTGRAFRSIAQIWKDAYMASQGIPTRVASFPHGVP
nr:hypothetical protein [Pseudomonadota bacterium]